MKKFIVFIITTIILAVSTSFTAKGQIKITGTDDRLVEVKSLHFGNTNKLVRKGDMFVYAITKTSNQFDNPMLLLLGKSKDEILESLNTLYLSIDTIGDEEVITIDNGFGTEYRLNKWVITQDMIKLAEKTKTELDPCFKVYSKKHAGYGTIWKSALKSAIDYFQN